MTSALGIFISARAPETLRLSLSCKMRVVFGIKPVPSALSVLRAKPDWIKRLMLVEDGMNLFSLIVFGLDRQERTAAAQRFGIDMRVLIWNAGADKGADNSTRCAASSRAKSGAGKPASGNDGTDARYRHQPQSGEKPGGSADGSANPGACSSFGAFIRVLIRDGVVIGIGLSCHKADSRRANAGCFQIAHCLLCVTVMFKHFCDQLHLVDFL